MKDIDSESDSAFGKPVLEGTSVTVEQVLRAFYVGATIEEIAEGFFVEPEKIRAVLPFAARAVEHRYPDAKDTRSKWSRRVWIPDSVESGRARRALTVLTSSPVEDRARLKLLLESKLARLIEDYRRVGDPLEKVEYYLNASVLTNDVSNEIAYNLVETRDRVTALLHAVDWENENPEPQDMTSKQFFEIEWRQLPDFLDDLCCYYRFDHFR